MSTTRPTPEPKTTRFEDFPLTRVEYITVMVHFYRGEVHRSTAWRQRLDATTNWAVLTAAGMLSLSFSSETTPHILLLLSNFILFAYLGIEARRFRYFVVYRSRVRMLEENFLLPVITRQLESPMISWREMLARDLDLPKYKTTIMQALGFRLRRNYIWIFLMILGGWLVKVMIHPHVAQTWEEMWDRIAVGHIPASVIILLGLAFYAFLALIAWYGRHLTGGEPEDEIAGLERNLEHWKL